MINMRDNTEVKDFIDAKIGYISKELDSDREQIHDPILSQQARGRVVSLCGSSHGCRKPILQLQAMEDTTRDVSVQ